MRFEKFVVKDFVLLGLMTALYAAIYLLLAFLTDALLPLFAHVAMQGLIALLFGGIIMVFLLHKIPKFGLFTLFTLIQVLLYTAFGMGYLPWVIAMLASALLADFISGFFAYKKKLTNAIAYGLTQLGIMAGGVIPVWFFTQNYIDFWVSKGQSLEKMTASANVLMGWSGASLLAICFLGGFFGIYIGHKLLDKHFEVKT